MKVFLKNTIIKKFLIVFITIIMTSNFIMPNYVHASVGSNLVSAFFYLIAYLGDQCIELMQGMMIGNDQIKNGDTYEIKYSPGVIFSNNVLALDINFIYPKTEEESSVSHKSQFTTISSNTYTSAGGVGISSDVNNKYEGESIISPTVGTTKGDRRNR